LIESRRKTRSSGEHGSAKAEYLSVGQTCLLRPEVEPPDRHIQAQVDPVLPVERGRVNEDFAERLLADQIVLREGRPIDGEVGIGRDDNEAAVTSCLAILCRCAPPRQSAANDDSS